MKRFVLVIILIFSSGLMAKAEKHNEKIKLAIDGLTHQHVMTFFRSNASEYFDLVGIAESDTVVIKKYQRMFGFSDSIVYPNLRDLLSKVKPDAVAGYNPIVKHIETVRLCAPRGIDVMVEKPLAINVKQAKEMQQLALENNIHLITNYETTWYPSLQYVYRQVSEGKVGEVTKLEVNCGHAGPIEIKIFPEFLKWLIKPETNGGGALTDFGCYGVNIATYFNKGIRPQAVTAIIATNKPDKYLHVEDEGIILLEYDSMQCIVQGSWNWPFSRKDLEVYGKTGYYKTFDSQSFGYRLNRKEKFKVAQSEKNDLYHENPYAYFSSLIKGRIKEVGYEPSALDNNVLVVEILEAALKSARTGKKVKLK